MHIAADVLHVARNILFSQGANPAAIVVFHIRRGVRAGPTIHARHLLTVADRGELAHFAQVIGWIVRAAGRRLIGGNDRFGAGDNG